MASLKARIGVLHLPGARYYATMAVEEIAWERVSGDLEVEGNAVVERLLAPDECDQIRALYQEKDLFRSKIVMERHGFGRGEYRYFNYPLPGLVSDLRTSLYPHLVPIANRWNEALRIGARYPATHAEYIQRCHQAGQDKPTPLLLKYGTDDYNCLHQDLYGEHIFPLQIAVLFQNHTKISLVASL